MLGVNGLLAKKVEYSGERQLLVLYVRSEYLVIWTILGYLGCYILKDSNMLCLHVFCLWWGIYLQRKQVIMSHL